jgi:hypothetical protein
VGNLMSPASDLFDRDHCFRPSHLWTAEPLSSIECVCSNNSDHLQLDMLIGRDILRW